MSTTDLTYVWGAMVTPAVARKQWFGTSLHGTPYGGRTNTVQVYRTVTPTAMDEDVARSLCAIEGVEELRKAIDAIGTVYWVCGNNMDETALDRIVEEFLVLSRRYRSARLRLEVTDRFDGDSKCPRGLSRIPPTKPAYEYAATTSAAS